MDEFLILLQAKLDEAASITNLNGANGDIAKLQGKLDALKLQATLDPDAAQKLANDIGNLINQKITISNINIDQGNVIKESQKIGREMGQQINRGMSQSFSKSENAIDSFKKSLANAGKSSYEIDNIIEKVKSLNVQIDSLRFSESTNGSMNINVSGIDEFNNKVKITQSLIKDLQTMKWNVSNTDTSIVSTKELDKINNAFANFTQKFEQFKSTNSSKLSGLTVPLSEFASSLNGLKQGTNTIDDVSNAFKLLQAEASKIDAPLKRQLSTFDSYKNAVDKGKESISGYRAELKGLANAPKELSQELTKASKLLLQINRTEATEGTTANWSNQAREFVDLLTNIGNKINVIKKEQSNAASTQVFNTKDLDAQGKIYIQKVNNTIAKTKSELESKLRNTGYLDIQIKGVEDASGKIKSLTANVTDATGAFKQLNFERAKIQNQGKAQSGFIQSDDVKIIGNISDSINTVQNNLSTLKSKWEEQGILVGEFKVKVEQMESSLASVGNKGELENLKSQIKSLKNETSTIAQVNKIQLSMGNGTYESKVDALVAKTQQWTDVNGNARISTNELSKAFDQLTTASNNYANSPTEAHQKALIASEKELDNQIKTVTNSVRSMNAELAKHSKVSSLHNQLADFMSKNGKTVKYFGNDLRDIFNQTEQGAKLTNQELAVLKQRFIDVQNTARASGKLGKTFFQTIREGMSSFSYWTSSTFLVMKAIQSIKGGIGTVKALDTALVDLKKTTTMTNSELEDFYYSSNKVAKQMGVTTEEIINQASAWSRLGFSSEAMATKMAKYSSMFASISPGLDLDSATDGLVSTMKAFSIGLDNADDVVDGIMSKINIIGNSKALNNSDIVDFLTRSSSALASANNSIEESIAMGEAIVEITRDAAGAGQVMKTTSMRIRGYDEELESYTEDLENLKGEIADLTKTAKTPGGISLFTDETKETYKSTYKILEEISGIWNDLTDKNQAQLLEVLAGKRNGQALAALISNFESAQESMDLMANSAGNAEAEMSVIMDKLNCPYVQKCA